MLAAMTRRPIQAAGPVLCLLLLWLSGGCKRSPGALTRAKLKPGEGYITSVLQHGDAVFAATDIGLYQASRSDKVWYKLPTPSSMPSWGSFARKAAPSSLLVYYTGPGEVGLMKEPAALYVSRDLGLSWERTSSAYNFLNVFVQSADALYAVAYVQAATPPGEQPMSYRETATDKDGKTVYPERRLLLSHDLGRTWSDISEGLPTQFENYVVPDPEHPGRVCVVTSRPMHAGPVCVYQATDEKFHWKQMPRNWDKLPNRRENVFGSLSPGSNNTNARANLSTLFVYPFLKWGNGLDVHTVGIETEKPAYTFRQHEPMPVALTVRFIFPQPPLKFYDHPDETVCWNLRGYVEQGDTFFIPSRATELYVNSPDHDAKMKQYAEDPRRAVVTLDNDHPYHRTIDLSRLCGFPGPGKYQIQPMKSFCTFFKEGVKEDASFAGQVIAVTIIP